MSTNGDDKEFTAVEAVLGLTGRIETAINRYEADYSSSSFLQAAVPILQDIEKLKSQEINTKISSLFLTFKEIVLKAEIKELSQLTRDKGYLEKAQPIYDKIPAGTEDLELKTFKENTLLLEIELLQEDFKDQSIAYDEYISESKKIIAKIEIGKADETITNKVLLGHGDSISNLEKAIMKHIISDMLI